MLHHMLASFGVRDLQRGECVIYSGEREDDMYMRSLTSLPQTD